MAAPLPGSGGQGPAPRGGGYGGGYGSQPGGGRSLGGGVYSVPARLRAPLPRDPWAFGNRENPTNNPGPTFYNPYGSVEGFEHYRHPLLRWGRGDTFPGGKPDLVGMGFPSVPRVQEISNAQNMLQGMALNTPRRRGTGIMEQNPDLLALLRERLGIGGGY